MDKSKDTEKFVTISCKAPQSLNVRLERLAKRDHRSKSTTVMLLLEWALKQTENGGKVAVA